MRLLQLGIYATPEQMALIRAIQESNPAALPATINQAAIDQGLPAIEVGYGLCVESREFIGLAEEELS